MWYPLSELNTKYVSAASPFAKTWRSNARDHAIHRLHRPHPPPEVVVDGL